MRVSSISNIYSVPRSFKKYCPQTGLNCPNCGSISDPVSTSNPNFRGKFGQYVGGTVGAGATLAGSIAICPPVAFLAGAGALVCMVLGDIAEDYINKEGEFQNEDEDKSKPGK